MEVPWIIPHVKIDQICEVSVVVRVAFDAPPVPEQLAMPPLSNAEGSQCSLLVAYQHAAS